MSDRVKSSEAPAERTGGEATRLDKPERSSNPAIPRAPDFGPRYRVLDRIGKGGMGEVYRAYDAELKTEVALKVITDDHEEALARFKREITLARKVSNANVLRIFDLGEHAGQRFLSMELIDGEDLGALMRREKRLPLDRALAIFRQVCEGLRAAHAVGVIHRDLKPQNVLIDRADQVRVADFGLARSIGESGLTRSGTVLGSPTYMSPEQVKGDPSDERSDIYSLGVMLYQLVSGEPPFRGDSPHAVMEMRLHTRPRPLKSLVPEIPSYVVAIVERCLELEPARRYPALTALIADLDAERAVPVARRRRWLVPLLAGALVATAAGIAIVATTRHAQTSGHVAHATSDAAISAGPITASGRTVIFVENANTTADPSFGALEMLVATALRQSRQLDIMTPTELQELVASDGLDIAKLDDAGYAKLASETSGKLLALHLGSARKGNGFTISLTAFDPSTHARVFSGTQDAADRNGVSLAGAHLAAALRKQLGDDVRPEEADKSGMSASLDADYEVSVADSFLHLDRDADAITHAQIAVQKDPKFAKAHSLLGIALWNQGRMPEARTELAQAYALRDSMVELDRLRLLADYYDLYGEPDRSIVIYQQTLDIWPRDRVTAMNLCESYKSRRDVKHAIELAKKLVADKSSDASMAVNLAVYEIMDGQFDTAAERVKNVVGQHPNVDAYVFGALEVAQWLAGKRAEAATQIASLRERDAIFGAVAAIDLALGEGRLADAGKLLDALPKEAKSDTRADRVWLLLATQRLRAKQLPAALAAAANVPEDSSALADAAMIDLAAGDEKRALAIAGKLADGLGSAPRARGKMIQAEAARLHHDLARARTYIDESIHLADYAEARVESVKIAIDAHQRDDAKRDLDIAYARRGELALDYDDSPKLRDMPVLEELAARLR